MAEYAKRDFSHFARDFFIYTTNFPLYVNERDSFRPKLFILHTKTAVCEMSSTFSPYMRKLVFEENENITLKTDEDFLRFLVPRCLRIHTKNHMTLTTVMSFIHEFLLYLQMNRLCFRFHFTAYKCLVAVFCRSYGEQWEPMDGWEGFQKHVRKNMIKMRPLGSVKTTIDQEPMLKEEFIPFVVDLLKNEDGNGFVLQESELSMIAEDDPRSLENDPDEVDDDPFVVDLTPPPHLVEQKARGFDDDNEFGIPLSSLLPVPSYEKPPIYSSSDDSEGSENDSPRDLSPSNSDLENYVSDNDSVSETGSYRHEQDNDDTYDEEYESNFENREFSRFEIYTSVMMKEAAQRYGAERFRDKLLQRKCEYCGIKCYQFSYDLFKKQLDSALVGRFRN